MVVLSPWPTYTHPNQIPSYTPACYLLTYLLTYTDRQTDTAPCHTLHTSSRYKQKVKSKTSHKAHRAVLICCCCCHDELVYEKINWLTDWLISENGGRCPEEKAVELNLFSLSCWTALWACRGTPGGNLVCWIVHCRFQMLIHCAMTGWVETDRQTDR